MKQNSADILDNILNILNNAVVFHSTMVMGSDRFFMHAVQCSADHLQLATYAALDRQQIHPGNTVFERIFGSFMTIVRQEKWSVGIIYRGYKKVNRL